MPTWITIIGYFTIVTHIESFPHPKLYHHIIDKTNVSNQNDVFFFDFSLLILIIIIFTHHHHIIISYHFLIHTHTHTHMLIFFFLIQKFQMWFDYYIINATDFLNLLIITCICKYTYTHTNSRI